MGAGADVVGDGVVKQAGARTIDEPAPDLQTAVAPAVQRAFRMQREQRRPQKAGLCVEVEALVARVARSEVEGVAPVTAQQHAKRCAALVSVAAATA